MVGNYLITSAWLGWHSVASYGCRYSADSLPFWTVLGAMGIDRIRGRALGRWAFGTLVALSIFIQSLGVFVNINKWNWMENDTVSHLSQFAWDMHPPQIWWQLRMALGLEDPVYHPPNRKAAADSQDEPGR
jgi:hypothetical protein